MGGYRHLAAMYVKTADVRTFKVTVIRLRGGKEQTRESVEQTRAPGDTFNQL